MKSKAKLFKIEFEPLFILKKPKTKNGKNKRKKPKKKN